MKKRQSHLARLQQVSQAKNAPSSPILEQVYGLYQQGRFKEGLALAEEAAPKNARNADFFGVAALCAKGCGELDKAEGFWRQALAVKPNFPDAHINLGVVLHNLKRYAEAEDSYRQGLSLRPDFAEAHYNLGELFKKTKRLAEAEASYRQALALKPDYADAAFSLGILLIGRWRFKEGFKRLWAAMSSRRNMA